MVMGQLKQETEVVVIGAGPGGYVAACRAADLGKEVILIDERERMGGVCLLEGCIPSKTYLHSVWMAELLKHSEEFGIVNAGGPVKPSFDLQKLRAHTRAVVDDLAKGVSELLKRKGVEVIRGRVRFESKSSLMVQEQSNIEINFRHCIIATGSSAKKLPKLLPNNPKVWNSTEALEIPFVPKRLAIVGGGYIGLEIGTVYAGLGSEITLIESSSQLLSDVDSDLVAILFSQYQNKFKNIFFNSLVTDAQESSNGIVITLENEKQEAKQMEFDAVLIAIGREANVEYLHLNKIALAVSSYGQIATDKKCMTKIPNIYAIGDVSATGPMLAHKAMREGKVAAEVIAGLYSAFEVQTIPAVVFTTPEVAWTGMTEAEALLQQREINVGKFPLRALGRARSIGQRDGLAKIITDSKSKLVLGVGLVGAHVSDLIAEATLAIDMGATLDDILLSIHPHPTLSEMILEAAEVAGGVSVHSFPSGHLDKL
ncbi:MAG: dihydrolipoyl dehydrogenase [Oligoflexia bacterium]|nr:dihydrolipoyl dehydrogenase [Oligoflexia bacterium]